MKEGLSPGALSLKKDFFVARTQSVVGELLGSNKLKEQGIRNLIRWSRRLDERYPVSAGNEETHKKVLDLTRQARSNIDKIIDQAKLPEVRQVGKAVTVAYQAGNECGKSIIVTVQRFNEANGYCYLASEIESSETLSEQRLLSHALIDTNLSDQSLLDSSLKTSCSWKAIDFESANHPRTAAVIFHALAEFVIHRAYLVSPKSISVEVGNSDMQDV